MAGKYRNLIIILSDQLDINSPVFEDFDKNQDIIWMAETQEEATRYWNHKLKIVYFFSAMRHFRDELKEKGYRVFYHELSSAKSNDRGEDLEAVLKKDIHMRHPDKLVVTQPGDFAIQERLTKLAKEEDLSLDILTDSHFYDTIESFNDFQDSKKGYLLETYYRHLRKRHGILLTSGDEPEGGDWNFDKENRESFNQAPSDIKAPISFRPDDITEEVIQMVRKRFDDHPGSLDHFDLPVSRKEALRLLNDFIEHRLKAFGKYQDAMWTGKPFLYHSRISAALNLKLLNPREVVEKAEDAYHEGDAPINSVEGFIRQIIGWREFIRGVYWREMPGYAKMNHLGAQHDVPSFFWDGDTDMECIHQSMQGVVGHAYAHHIQRLMVLGLFSLLYGTHPRKFHEWHVAMYADAHEWVSLPNALGMSQYGDGGIVGTKPYTASANYINKMSNYCKNCRYSPNQKTGEDACPFNALYWDFLDRHHDKLNDNRRMNFQMKNLEKKDDQEMKEIRSRARKLKKDWSNG
ncbi:cryptochrome/photolyase family protein [Roseivirga sp. BDSF3-8]|uniref:cryptochrome/photolyase family protein n=1 Tax=Roseivirga sp. BDSF3-8 TaxID=3241598 RepID=UPI003532044C